jgi:lipopolysaccharide export system permease protein
VHDPVVASELGWRIFVPFAIVVALLLAVALSEVSPRQGRYLKLFPALLIFASLIVALMAIKTRSVKKKWVCLGLSVGVVGLCDCGSFVLT